MRKERINGKILIIGAVIALIVAAAGIFTVQKQQKAGLYLKKIEEGQRYLNSFEYEDAVLAFSDAVEIQDKEPEGYEGLATAYSAQEQYGKAKSVLKKGVKKTESKKLKRMISRIDKLQDERARVRELVDTGNLDALSANVNVDDSIFSVFVSYTSEDYAREYGEVQKSNAGGGRGWYFRYDNFPGVCCYRNTGERSRVIDMASGNPYIRQRPTEVMLNDISALFTNFRGAVTRERLQTIFKTEISCIWNQEEERNEITWMYRDCIITVESDANGNIVKQCPWNLISIKETEENAENGKNNIGGSVVNAVNGSGISGVSIKFREGAHKKQGAVAAECTTNSNGYYETYLKAGEYTAEMAAAGYTTEYVQIKVTSETENRHANASMSPLLNEGEVRIVLEWGAVPRDLDSHLTGKVDGGNNIHVYYGDKRAETAGTTVAMLDLDDITSYGPETTTLYRAAEGVFEFSVEDFTNRGNSGCSELANSGATVKVYLPGEETKVFSVPGGTGTIWNVFRLDHGEIVPINTIR